MRLLKIGLLPALFAIVFVFSCKKSDHGMAPAISYQQKVISIPVEMPMTPVKPDSTGGAITEYAINPLLPKGLMFNRTSGEISGTPSDSLQATQFVVTAKGPHGTGTDTITLLIGTVGFNYGTSGTFTFEKDSRDLVTTAISPLILAGTFNLFLVSSPFPDSFTIKTGLTFNPKTGQISGTPSKLTTATEDPAPATFVITGISTSNKAASTTIRIFINDKKPNFTYPFSGSFSSNNSVGSVLNPSISITSGVIKKYRLAPTSPALPAGLSLDSTNGRITGTPATAGNTTIIIRGINSGGYQDVSLPLVITTTAAAPEVRYMMSLASGNVVDTLCPRILTGNTIYLTKSDGTGQTPVYLNPVATAGQVGTYTITPNPPTGLSFSSGLVSGTVATGAASSTSTVTINNAISGGPTGTFNMNFVANAPFFTYNADGGKGNFFANAYGFVVNQKIDVANGNYPGYQAVHLAPVGGTEIISYTIYPVTTANGIIQPLSNIGLNFNTTTGAISGTPTLTTSNLSNLVFYDYVIVGKKADGSFTYYRIKIKVYPSLSEWGK